LIAKTGIRHAESQPRQAIADSSDVPAGQVAIRPTVRMVQGRLDPVDLALFAPWIAINQEVLIKY